MSKTNVNGWHYPEPVLDGAGKPVRPSSEPYNTPPPTPNYNTRAAFPPGHLNDERMEE